MHRQLKTIVLQAKTQMTSTEPKIKTERDMKHAIREQIKINKAKYFPFSSKKQRQLIETQANNRRKKKL